MMMLTVFMPPSLKGTIFETQGVVNGNPQKIVYAPRLHNGHLVIDVPRAFFISMLSSPQGRQWETENPEAVAWLGQNDRGFEVNDAFPGADRPPPNAAVVNEVAPPVMVRMRAPTGATSYSHGGAEYEIGKDGTVTVDEHVAAVLRSHGFIPA
jgi:hypothetical protein